jgi:cobalt transporter subunit CbtB
MTTQTQISTASKAQSLMISAFLAAFIGGAMLFVAGHAQSATLHDAAHDVRHATGFPCH